MDYDDGDTDNHEATMLVVQANTAEVVMMEEENNDDDDDDDGQLSNIIRNTTMKNARQSGGDDGSSTEVCTLKENFLRRRFLRSESCDLALTSTDCDRNNDDDDDDDKLKAVDDVCRRVPEIPFGPGKYTRQNFTIPTETSSSLGIYNDDDDDDGGLEENNNRKSSAEIPEIEFKDGGRGSSLLLSGDNVNDQLSVSDANNGANNHNDESTECNNNNNNHNKNNNNNKSNKRSEELSEKNSEELSDDDDQLLLMSSDYNKYKILLSFNEAPFHLRFNQFIKRGYRGNLPVRVCMDSVFWLTNESVNIWSHFFGWLLFLGLMFYDLFLLNIHASLADKFLVGGLLICFQFCMIASALYHTFNCHSEEHFQCFLKYDLFGIACSLLAIYLSGIYYAFWCNVEWCLFYIGTILLIFILVLLIQIFHDNPQLKLISFVSWAAFGVVPTVHWTFTMGGWGNPIVQKLLPRVINMYIISGSAFGIYASYVPERFFPGRFDFIGSSHQLWHIFVVFALYYWHNTGINYIEYRMSHSCLVESQY